MTGRHISSILGNGLAYARRHGLVPAAFRLSAAFDCQEAADFLRAADSRDLAPARTATSTATHLIHTEPLLPRNWPLARQAWREGYRSAIFPTLTGWQHGKPIVLLATLLLYNLPALAWGRLLTLPNKPLARRLQRKKPVAAFFALLARLARPRLARAVRHALAAAPVFTPDQVSDRIVIANSDLSPGGAEGNAFFTLIGLRSQGQSAEMLCLRETQGQQVYHADSGTPIHVVPPAFGGITSDTAAILQDAAIANLVATLPASIAHDLLQFMVWYRQHRPRLVHSWQDYLNITAGFAAVLSGTPRVILNLVSVSPLHFQFYRCEMQPIYRLLAQHPSVTLVANSAAGARDYERWLGLEEGHIKVVYHGLNPDRVQAISPAEVKEYRDALGVPEHCLLIGSLLRFTPVKDPYLWLETAAHVIRTLPEARFLLVGDGELRDSIGEKAYALGLKDHLLMPGVTNRPALPLAAMDCLLMTSHQEGVPNVILEAQAMGIPVVATAVGGVAEGLEHARTGWALETRDPAQLAEKVVAVLTDAAWRAHAHLRAPLFNHERFSQERMIAETLAIYGQRSET